MKYVSKLALTLLLCLVCTGVASANSWGLSNGRTLTRVAKSHDWDDYACAAQLESNCMSIAVMHSRYHAVLLASCKDDSGQWFDYPPCTACLYQPSEGRAQPKLEQNGVNGFVIAYPDTGERYVFSMQINPWSLGDNALSVTLNGMSVDGVFTSSYDENSALWSIAEEGKAFIDPERVSWIGHISLSDFSIHLAPKNAGELRHLSAMSTALWSYFSPADENGTERKVPVYVAPLGSAAQAGDGKACVSLPGGVKCYGTLRGYDLVEYTISQRSSRIGFIRHGMLGDNQVPLDENGTLTRIPVTTRATYLTDDPHISQRHVYELSGGTELTLLCNLTPFYGYAVYVTLDGQEVWGFVPLRDVALPVKEVYSAEDVMRRLTGEWLFYAGGLGHGSSDIIAFYDDGACYSGHVCRYDVQPCDSSRGDYWNNPDFEILFTEEDGRVIGYGLTISDHEQLIDGEYRHSFSLSNDESSGGYVFLTDDPQDITVYEAMQDEEGNG